MAITLAASPNTTTSNVAVGNRAVIKRRYTSDTTNFDLSTLHVCESLPGGVPTGRAAVVAGVIQAGWTRNSNIVLSNGGRQVDIVLVPDVGWQQSRRYYGTSAPSGYSAWTDATEDSFAALANVVVSTADAALSAGTPFARFYVSPIRLDVAPAWGTTGHPADQPVVLTFELDAAIAGSLTLTGATIAQDAPKGVPTAPIILNGVPQTGFTAASTVALSNSDRRLTMSVIPDGGWAAETLYGWNPAAPVYEITTVSTFGDEWVPSAPPDSGYPISTSPASARFTLAYVSSASGTYSGGGGTIATGGAVAFSTAPVGTPPTITTTTLASATLGSPYTAPVEATGGTTPYSWALAPGSGPLPPGLVITASGAPNAPNTQIIGTPLLLGTFTFTVRVTDDAALTDDQAFTLVVALPDLVLAQPRSDTFRGGSVVAVATSLVVDRSADAALRGQALPGGWSSTTTSGSRLMPSASGVVLQSTTAGLARLTGPTLLTVGELSLYVDRCTSGLVQVTCGSILIELEADRIRARVTGGPPGSTHAIFGAFYKISIARSVVGGHVWVSITDPAQASRALVEPYLGAPRRLLLAAPVVDSGALIVSATLGARTVVRDVTVRPAASIDGQLLLDMRAEVDRRVVGRVPRTTIDRVGTRSLVAFSAAAEISAPDGFEYTLPDGRRAGAVVDYGDPALRDDGARVGLAEDTDL